MGGAAFVFAHIDSPGVVEQTGGPRRILFGELDGARTTRASMFLDELHRADIDAEVVNNIELLWDKYAFLCALSRASPLPHGCRSMSSSKSPRVESCSGASSTRSRSSQAQKASSWLTTSSIRRQHSRPPWRRDHSRRFTTTSAPDTDSNSTLSMANCSDAPAAISSTSPPAGSSTHTPQTMGTRQPCVGGATPTRPPVSRALSASLSERKVRESVHR